MNYLNNTSGSQLGGSAIEPIKETPVTRLDGALAQLRVSVKLVEAVADKLVGETSKDGATNTSSPTRPGVFGEIEDIADMVSRLAYRIDYSANRISERL